MTDGLQRECPSCGELNQPDGRVCLECGAWLVEPSRLTDDELKAVTQDWYRLRPHHHRVVDPEQHERDLNEWDRHPWNAEPPQDRLYVDGEELG